MSSNWNKNNFCKTNIAQPKKNLNNKSGYLKKRLLCLI